jgi:hypothetical protein
VRGEKKKRKKEKEQLSCEDDNSITRTGPSEDRNHDLGRHGALSRWTGCDVFGPSGLSSFYFLFLVFISKFNSNLGFEFRTPT